MNLKPYVKLTHVDRGAPCKEWPGVWLVYVGGQEVYGSREFEIAYHVANDKSNEFDSSIESNDKVSICWCCSEDDPRIGFSWFTGFYQHGKFNQFGQYIT